MHSTGVSPVVMDRNYPSYRMAATLHQQQRGFVIRCSRASFKQARAMLRGEGANSQCVTLRPGTDQAQLDARPTRQPQQVNRAVAFAAIKQQALDLLFSDLDAETLCDRPTALFLTNPVACPRSASRPR